MITLTEFSRITGMTRPTVYKEVEKGVLQYKIVEGRYMFDEDYARMTKHVVLRNFPLSCEMLELCIRYVTRGSDFDLKQVPNDLKTLAFYMLNDLHYTLPDGTVRELYDRVLVYDIFRIVCKAWYAVYPNLTDDDLKKVQECIQLSMQSLGSGLRFFLDHDMRDVTFPESFAEDVRFIEMVATHNSMRSAYENLRLDIPYAVEKQINLMYTSVQNDCEKATQLLKQMFFDHGRVYFQIGYMTRYVDYLLSDPTPEIGCLADEMQALCSRILSIHVPMMYSHQPDTAYAFNIANSASTISVETPYSESEINTAEEMVSDTMRSHFSHIDYTTAQIIYDPYTIRDDDGELHISDEIVAVFRHNNTGRTTRLSMDVSSIDLKDVDAVRECAIKFCKLLKGVL